MSSGDWRQRLFAANFQKNLLAGLLTITPLVVVWLVFDFFLNALALAGHPLAVTFIQFAGERAPGLRPWLADPTVQWLVGAVMALLALYVIGAIASRVVGERLIALVDVILTRIPLVETIYSAAKKLVGVIQRKPEGIERVVLVDFPSEGMKAIGFVMQTFPDAKTGEDLAAVFVPTSPNPTTGYLVTLPVSKLISTDIPMDQAMTMVLSGGAIVPTGITLQRG
ncbi:MAG TPA: DUF502 domain-containing protein [Rhizomicrobium sp.]